MIIIPLHLRQANTFVANMHRHHGPVVGYKFALGIKEDIDNAHLIGVAICGRPVARMSNDGFTLEVLRLATDGTKNACSMLYGACARVSREMGYHRIQTYTLSSEPGTSLRASGWKFDGITSGHSWNVPSRPRIDKHPIIPKKRWILNLV